MGTTYFYRVALKNDAAPLRKVFRRFWLGFIPSWTTMPERAWHTTDQAAAEKVAAQTPGAFVMDAGGAQTIHVRLFV